MVGGQHDASSIIIEWTPALPPKQPTLCVNTSIDEPPSTPSPFPDAHLICMVSYKLSKIDLDSLGMLARIITVVHAAKFLHRNY